MEEEKPPPKKKKKKRKKPIVPDAPQISEIEDLNPKLKKIRKAVVNEDPKQKQRKIMRQRKRRSAALQQVKG